MIKRPGQKLIMDPPLLLLDELTAGWTRKPRTVFAVCCGRCTGHGLTVVMVTHDLDTF
jgi:ABC-type Mn2+/Zn2+ transport system ATPase subunit